MFKILESMEYSSDTIARAAYASNYSNAVQVYSENTIKTEESYSLKTIADQINFDYFTEVDTWSKLSISDSTITVTDLPRNLTTYAYYDCGVNFFSGDFSHNIDIKMTTIANASIIGCWSLQNDVEGFAQTISNSHDGLFVYAYATSTSKFSLTVYEVNNGAGTYAEKTNLDKDTWYYLTIRRSEAAGTYGTLYCDIYSDAARTSLVNTITRTLSEKQDFRYLMSGYSYNDSYAYAGSALISNLDLYNMGLSTNVTVTRTLSSSIDLTNYSCIYFDVRASRTGSNFKLGIQDSGGTTTEKTINIITADTWQTEILYLTGISLSNKDAINKIILTIINADVLNNIYLDNVYALDLATYLKMRRNRFDFSGISLKY